MSVRGRKVPWCGHVVAAADAARGCAWCCFVSLHCVSHVSRMGKGTSSRAQLREEDCLVSHEHSQHEGQYMSRGHKVAGARIHEDTFAYIYLYVCIFTCMFLWIHVYICIMYRYGARMHEAAGRCDCKVREKGVAEKTQGMCLNTAWPKAKSKPEARMLSYRCAHINVYMYIYVNARLLLCPCMWMYQYASSCVCTYAYVYKCECIHIYIPIIYLCILMDMCIYTYIHICIYIYTHIYIYTSICIYIYII